MYWIVNIIEILWNYLPDWNINHFFVFNAYKKDSFNWKPSSILCKTLPKQKVRNVPFNRWTTSPGSWAKLELCFRVSSSNSNQSVLHGFEGPYGRWIIFPSPDRDKNKGSCILPATLPLERAPSPSTRSNVVRLEAKPSSRDDVEIGWPCYFDSWNFKLVEQNFNFSASAFYWICFY